MERLELVLLVPDEHEHDEWEGTTSRSDYRPRYTDREQLFPVRQIKEIGFYHLKQLKVVIKYSDHIDAGAKTTKQAEDRLDEWVDSEMVDISASGLNGKVTVIYELCMDRNLAFSLNTSYKERPLVDVNIERVWHPRQIEENTEEPKNRDFSPRLPE